MVTNPAGCFIYNLYVLFSIVKFLGCPETTPHKWGVAVSVAKLNNWIKAVLNKVAFKNCFSILLFIYFFCYYFNSNPLLLLKQKEAKIS